MKSLLLALSLFIAMGCSPYVYTPKDELSIEAILQVNEMGAKAQHMEFFGLIDRPDAEWFAMLQAYYMALNVAWSHGDEEDMEYFSGKIEDLYQELIKDQDDSYLKDIPEDDRLGQEL